MATNYEFGIRLAVDGEQQVVAATDRAGKGFTDMGKEADRGSQLANNLIGRLSALATAYIGTQTITAFVQTADAMNLLDARLRVATGAGNDFKASQEEIYRIAQKNNIGLADAQTLYTKLYDPVKKLGGGTKETADIVEAFTTGLRISGATTAEASSATLQFSQAMGSGVLRGEEFNSVNEAAPRIIRALSDSLGVGQGELRKMAEEGKLTAEVVGGALTTQLENLRREAAKMPDTVGGAFTRLSTDAAIAAQEFDKFSGATGTLAGAMDLLAKGLNFVTRDFRNFFNGGDAPLKEATNDVIELNRRATILRNGMEAGFYGPNFQKELDDTNAKLVIAKQRFRELDQQLGVTTATQEGMVIQGKERERVERSLAASAKGLDEIRQQLSGTDKNYLPTLQKLQQYRTDGILGESEYIRLVSDLANKNGKKAESTKAVADADRQAKAAAKELSDQQERQSGLVLDLTGLSKDYGQKVRDLNDLVGRGAITHETYYLALDKLQAKTPASIQHAKDLAAAQKLQNDEFDRAWTVMEKDREQIEKRIGAARGYLEKIQEETADLKLSKGELALVTAERELERKGVEKGTEAYDAYIAKIRAAVVDKENTTAAIGEMKRIEDAAKTTADNIEKGMIDSLFRAFESGKDFFSTLWGGIKNTFKTEILVPIIKDVLSPFAQAWRSIASQISNTVLSPVVNFVTSGLGLGSVSGTASAGTSAANGASGLGSLASLGSTIAGSLGALGSGASAGFALGVEGIGASLSMIGSASGATSLAGGIGQLIGSAGPYALAAVAALAIANKLFGSKGGPKVSGMANTGGFSGIPGGGSADAEAATILGNVQSLYTGTTSALGGTAGAFTGAAFLARDPNGTALTQLVLDAAINGKQVYSRNNRTGGGNVEDVGRDPQQFADAVAAAQTQALLASLKATTFADADVTAALAAIDANASAADISGRIQSIVQAKAAKDAQAAAAAGPAPGTGVGTAGDYMGPGVMSTITPTQYDDGVASLRSAVENLAARVDSFKADNTAENTSMAVLLKQMERILVRVSGGADNPGDALSVRVIPT